jgi:hypothetical protein
MNVGIIGVGLIDHGIARNSTAGDQAEHRGYPQGNRAMVRSS